MVFWSRESFLGYGPQRRFPEKTRPLDEKYSVVEIFCVKSFVFHKFIMYSLTLNSQVHRKYSLL